MNRLQSRLKTPEETVSNGNQTVLVLSRDDKLRREIAREIGGTYYLVPCESLISLKMHLKSRTRNSRMMEHPKQSHRA